MSAKSFDPTKPVQTKSGRPARILCTDLMFKGNANIIVAAVTELDGHEMLVIDPDLINIPEKIEGWAVITTASSEHIFPTREQALSSFNKSSYRKWSTRRAIACIPISFTEGEGL